MAEITFFHYVHRNTALHRMDGRLKVLCMLLLVTAVSLATSWYHYFMLMCVIVTSLLVSKLPLITMLKKMKILIIMIIIVLVISGFYFAGRLGLMILISTIMASTTSLSTIKNAIEWYLRPIPFVPEVKVAMMMNLVFVLIPVIFDNHTEMVNAQKARGIELNKNPIIRIKLTVIPLLVRTFRRADELVYAMEARCYSEVRTRAVFETNKIDWLLLLLCIAILVFVTL